MQKTNEVSQLRQQASWKVSRRALLERELFRGQGLDGSQLVWQRRRCGKAGCRCGDGEGHGPYLYRVRASGSRRRLLYVPAPQTAAAQQARQAYEDHQRNLAEYMKLNREIEELFGTIATSGAAQGSEN